ncbi:16S rRNA (guanine(527)-N(7))-methyltransferase RsmG [Geobacter sulfurreducens]|uniref:16S rRNA (guanine(527)-N(7))-methyltransferase RsmG n=1 Tax=Geobacter sulfurreducens TaxID=35554 RepID=UPI000DBB4493|nr:16S rRNA (guanine(527)-N(7))-methyltransferase RsmG [Geobacter sulfurreducens]BBA71884.1 Ribosomal RNA small subunit methyltransferase G [Geobacter sulfurreducens]
MNARACRILQEGAAELRVEISDELVTLFSLFADELKKWNRKINLTAITSDEEIALKHFVDSLALCRLVSVDDELLDLGSGGGFPVLPLALVFPTMTAVSVDAVEKKIIFQRHAARLLGCRRFAAIHARGEDLPRLLERRFNRIVSRAFSDIPSFARMALPLLMPQGTIIAMKGRGGAEEADAARGALEEMGLTVIRVTEYRLPFSGDARTLVEIGFC